MKTTLDEAQHSWEHVKSGEGINLDGGHEISDQQFPSGTDEEFVKISTLTQKIIH